MAEEKLVLRQLAIGVAHEISLSQERFEELRLARHGLARMLGVEEKFDMLMENYAELEDELLIRTARSLLFSELSWDHMMGVMALIDRRLLNLLAAARMYVDHVPRDLKAIGFDSAAFEADASAQYDACLGYRVMVALRNYAQHKGAVVRGLSYAWPRSDEGGRAHTIEFALRLEDLQADAAFKKPVLNELLALGEPKLELKPNVRDYISSLNKIHRSMRERTKLQLDQWNATLSNAIQEYQERFGPETKGLAAARIRLINGQERGVIEKFYLLDETRQRFERLTRRNACRPGLETHSVSSR
jgi:hypothetical protein